jgi:hypothetical protein
MRTLFRRSMAVADVRSGSVKRVASAVGEGSIVVPEIHRFLGNLLSSWGRLRGARSRLSLKSSVKRLHFQLGVSQAAHFLLRPVVRTIRGAKAVVAVVYRRADPQISGEFLQQVPQTWDTQSCIRGLKSKPIESESTASLPRVLSLLRSRMTTATLKEKRPKPYSSETSASLNTPTNPDAEVVGPCEAAKTAIIVYGRRIGGTLTVRIDNNYSIPHAHNEAHPR